MLTLMLILVTTKMNLEDNCDDDNELNTVYMINLQYCLCCRVVWCRCPDDDSDDDEREFECSSTLTER